MKKLILFLIALASVIIVNAAPKKVACVGNSITYGFLVKDREQNCYPAQLQQMMGDDYVVRNFGKSRSTLLDEGHVPYRQQPEYQEALDFAPDIVVIHLGVNDTDPRNWPDYSNKFAGDYKKLVDAFRAVNPNVRVLISKLTPLGAKHPRFTSTTRSWRSEINALLPHIAQALDAEYFDIGEGLADRPELMPDAIHPNVKGATILAKNVYGAITGDYGGLKMSPVYRDWMVLQRDEPLRIRGRANANEKITVTLGHDQASAISTNTGYWQVTLPPQNAALNLNFTVASDNDTIKIKHVAVGEVWLASGQSNMAFSVNASAERDKIIENCSDDSIRFFVMRPRPNKGNAADKWSDSILNLTEDLNYYQIGNWDGMKPSTTRWVSAVAYNFAKNLRDSLNVPVGIIQNAIGGSPTEAWVDVETLEQEIPGALVNVRNNDYIDEWVRKRASENSGDRRHVYDPAYLFATGIKPLDAYPIKGVIWYQGESNASRIELHEKYFQMVVDGWRRYWDSPGLPFVFAQLSSLNRTSWPKFRNSQRMLEQKIDNAWMAVTSDLGDSLNVHPTRKAPIGRRMAAQALYNVYGHDAVIPSGPMPEKATLLNDSIIVTFNYADGLSTADTREPLTFEVAEFPGLFSPAKAKIVDNKIVIYDYNLKTPRYVRYGWQPFTRANLINSANMPTSTFEIEITRHTEAEKGYEKGVSAAFGGVLPDGKIIVGGGCNFPENPLGKDSKKKFYSTFFTLDPQDGHLKPAGNLPHDMAYGVSASTGKGIFIGGGQNASGSLKNFYLLQDDLTLSPLPSLPYTLDNAYAAAEGNKVYIVGGNIDGVPSNKVLLLDLDEDNGGWHELPPFPGEPRVQPAVAIANGFLYVFGGFAPAHNGQEASLQTSTLALDLKKRKWSKKSTPTDSNGRPLSLGGGVAVTLADGKILATGGVNAEIFLNALKKLPENYLSHEPEWYGFTKEIMIYDPKTDRWTQRDSLAEAARAGALALRNSDKIYIFGGELKPRIRTPKLLVLKAEK